MIGLINTQVLTRTEVVNMIKGGHILHRQPSCSSRLGQVCLAHDRALMSNHI